MTQKYKYHFLKYNRHHVLKLNFLLVLSMVFLTKETILTVMAAASAFKSKGAANTAGLYFLIDTSLWPTNLPVLALWWSYMKRSPESSSVAQRIWHNGRYLIAVSAFLGAAIFISNHRSDLVSYSPMHFGILGVYSSILLYVTLSSFVTDLFKEFPDQTNSPEKPS
jgi:hypothetical protein